MKILMIIPELSTGGAQRSFSKLAMDLARRHEVHVVIFNTDYPVKYAVPGSIHFLNVHAGTNNFDKFVKFVKRVLRLAKLKKSLLPDVAISFLEGADYVNILSRRKEKVIVSIRGSKSDDLQIAGLIGFLRKKIFMPWLYRKASTVVSVSKFLQQEMIKTFNVPSTRSITIHNYYELDLMKHQSNQHLPIKFDAWITGKIIINVGRLHAQKNQLFIINLFPSIKHDFPDAKLVLIGDGPLRVVLAQAAEATGLRTYLTWGDEFSDDFDIYFLGEQTNPFPFLKRSHIFLLSSLYEGFPNVLIEALACGLSVLASDCNFGPREILADDRVLPVVGAVEQAEYGVLLPPPEINNQKIKELWIEAIGLIFSNEQLRLYYQNKAHERVEHFSRERILHQWYDLIERQ